MVAASTVSSIYSMRSDEMLRGDRADYMLYEMSMQVTSSLMMCAQVTTDHIRSART